MFRLTWRQDTFHRGVKQAGGTDDIYFLTVKFKVLQIKEYQPISQFKMDSTKKKMEKLANETKEAEARIAHFEEIKLKMKLKLKSLRNN